MITGITIENFKGIREPVRLDFRPITLLFGANSAGKSTILHALHYAREVFERHNLDADTTITGGKHIDLGGFKHFIHRHDSNDALHPEKRLRLRVDLAASTKSFHAFDADINSLVKRSVEDVDRHDVLQRQRCAVATGTAAKRLDDLPRWRQLLSELGSRIGQYERGTSV